MISLSEFQEQRKEIYSKIKELSHRPVFLPDVTNDKARQEFFQRQEKVKKEIRMLEYAIYPWTAEKEYAGEFKNYDRALKRLSRIWLLDNYSHAFRNPIMKMNLQPKPNKFNYTECADFHAEILPRCWIRIFGQFINFTPKKFDLRFEIGSLAVFNSYNLIYTGPIFGISEKSVQIADHDIMGKTTMLDLYTFVMKNWDFDLERIQRHNNSWSD